MPPEAYHWAPAPTQFTVQSCSECQSCSSPPTVALGSACRADCDCKDSGAVCDINRLCTLYCLSSSDCPTGFRCGQSPSTQAFAFVCDSELRPECSETERCPKGFACEVTARGLRRCVHRFDTRTLSHGIGIHCGCDAECPGEQRCVKYEFNFVNGFCAHACRDARDCPRGWRCLEMTESGLEAVCVPP